MGVIYSVNCLSKMPDSALLNLNQKDDSYGTTTTEKNLTSSA